MVVVVRKKQSSFSVILFDSGAYHVEKSCCSYICMWCALCNIVAYGCGEREALTQWQSKIMNKTGYRTSCRISILSVSTKYEYHIEHTVCCRTRKISQGRVRVRRTCPRRSASTKHGRKSISTRVYFVCRSHPLREVAHSCSSKEARLQKLQNYRDSIHTYTHHSTHPPHTYNCARAKCKSAQRASP